MNLVLGRHAFTITVYHKIGSNEWNGTFLDEHGVERSKITGHSKESVYARLEIKAARHAIQLLHKQIDALHNFVKEKIEEL